MRNRSYQEWKLVQTPFVDKDTGVAVAIQSIGLPRPKYRCLIGRIGAKGDFMASLPAYFISFEDFRIVKKYREAINRLMEEAEAEVDRLAQKMRDS